MKFVLGVVLLSLILWVVFFAFVAASQDKELTCWQFKRESLWLCKYKACHPEIYKK
jgi:Ni,Fe-hydrogenase I cytochrome b subunit